MYNIKYAFSRLKNCNINNIHKFIVAKYNSRGKIIYITIYVK